MYDPALGRTFQLDPASDEFSAFSPYSWVANNPISLIDPDGKRWKDPDEDQKKANSISNVFRKRETSLAKKEERIQKRIDKAESKGNIGKVERLTSKKENVTAMKEDMVLAQQEITAMGADPEKTFTFNQLEEGSSAGYISTDNEGTTVINYTGDRGNLIHELKHAAQVQQGLLVGERGTDLFTPNAGFSLRKSEVQAYQRQFAAGYSLPKSGFRAPNGTIHHVSTPNTFRGIGSNISYLRGIYYTDRNGVFRQPYYNPILYSR
jgi:hypothetical protein